MSALPRVTQPRAWSADFWKPGSHTAGPPFPRKPPTAALEPGRAAQVEPRALGGGRPARECRATPLLKNHNVAGP